MAIAVALSGLTLWLAARSARIDQLKWAFAGANYWWLVPYPLLGILLNMIRGEIWRRFLDKRVSSPQAFWAYTVGFLVNNVLPFRLGEAARVVVLARRSALPIVEVAAAA
ncbi:MAG TPA: lysylphosphatidylglycerol synthase domain-containing protein, partial [Vicinamibacterales bacterium]|nr:lysylphosphatidylglycerol synthase domain-containing protein [Vicinamibacterales bacterium]